MANISIGKEIAQPQGFKAFIPDPFPPRTIRELLPQVQLRHTNSLLALGRLNGIAGRIPENDYDFFLLMFLRKDATASSQIEGTGATFIDALEAESGVSTDLPDDVDDIIHALEATRYGLDRLHTFPLSLRFICEIHQELMTGARSTHHADPGNFRRTQNWIGGTSPANARFVPPPVFEMKQALNDLEKYMVDNGEMLPLIKAGLLHAQFEAIHPFLDGNGRTGRMLVTMYLMRQKILHFPLLYLSSYFKRHQDTYYDRLNGYHSNPSLVVEWLDFFLEGCETVANSASDTAEKVLDLREEDMRKIQSLGAKSAQSGVLVLRNLFGLPIVDASRIMQWTGFTRPGAHKLLDRFVDLGILELVNPGEYKERYRYTKYINLFT